MVFRVDYLIYIYMLLCLCILLFDVAYILNQGSRERRAEKLRQNEETWLRKQIEDGPLLPLDEKTKQKRIRELGRSSRMLLFSEAVTSLSQTPDSYERLQLWIDANRDMFFKILTKIKKKDDTIHNALVAYIVWQFRLCGKSDNDPFILMMQQIVLRHSIYCRQNALSAIYISGETKHVIKTYRMLASHSIEHHAKLLTEGLLMFTGSHQELADQLWEIWDMLPSSYQVACINYFRLVTDGCCSRLLPLLQDKEGYSEVHYAIIRYFRKHYYAPATETLQNFAFHRDQFDWEYATIAALALENYPGEESVHALLECCRSTNWHIRENAAESLLKISDIASVRAIAERETDRYAKEMLVYKCKEKAGAEVDGCNQNTPIYC